MRRTPEQSERDSVLHVDREDWRVTPRGDARGYIQPETLTELWFHTGTVCNLRCPFCLEGSKPGDNRIERITLEDARPFMDEAVAMGVEKFSFTGGEPFVIEDMARILGYALELRPCLVLTNATEPLANRMTEVLPLLGKPNKLHFRVSLDYPEEARHDAGRGAGNFRRSVDMLRRLHEAGFAVSVARQCDKGEDPSAVDAAFRGVFEAAGLPADIPVIWFPDFMAPGASRDVPFITEDCMTRYHTAESRAAFMCNYSKMIVKKGGRMRVYACTLVDDDEDYDVGGTLAESMPVRVMLKHHRCYACFSTGCSCSEK